MKYVYICGAVPAIINDMQGDSVAGNKFSLNMAKAIDEAVNGALAFYSTAPVCARLKKPLDLSLFSITIDTPFTKAFCPKGV